MNATEDVQASAQTLEDIPLEKIQPSTTNPRKHFDEAYIAELGGSIRTVGVLEPLLVRPLKGGRYELVAGERRYRAAKLVNYPAVPCVVRTLTDLQVLEHQVIENLQREDLHPLEEADGYRRLMLAGDYDVDALAKRVHKSAKYIYDRIKLLQLTPELQQAFLAQRFTPAHAVILARLAAADQKRAADRNKGGLWESEDAEEYLFSAEELKRGAYDPLKPRTSRELQSWVDQHVRFAPKDADPMLFPETASALATAKQDGAEDRVIAITHEHYVQPEAKTNTRIYGPRSWKRADGEVWTDETRHPAKTEKSKTCEKSRLGMVVAGERRGEAYLVCVSKSCEIHWPAQAKKAKAKAGGKPTTTSEETWEVRNKRIREEQERRMEAWRVILPELKTAVAVAVKKAPAASTGALAAILVKELQISGSMKGLDVVPLGRTAEDFMRHQVFRLFLDKANGAIYEIGDAARLAKGLGVDADKLHTAAVAKKKAAPSPAKPKPAAKKNRARK